MYEEGGLATDGLEVDPVSGNDIPPGSNAEDVRDDVDAQLSSGEYVVPADVVKYFGVSYFEKLRTKAKAGLEEMDKDGRMGGEPVAEPSFEEDMMAAEGYAAGGVVDSNNNVDGIIDRVKAAALKDPSVSNLLKSKGIFIQEDSKGPAVQGQASPQQFAEGGSVLTGQYSPQNNASDFNPYTYTPGFSAESGVTGNAPTIPGTVPTPGTGGNGGGSAAPAPVQCPPGYTLDPATNTCVPEAGRRKDTKPIDHDPEEWMKKYDYSDPDTLFEQSMNTLGMGESDEEKGFMEKATGVISGFFDNGIFGKIFKSQKRAEVLANAAVLESHGFKDKAAQLREAIGGYTKTNDLKVGGFFDSSKWATKMAMGKYGQTDMMNGRMASASSKSAPDAGRPTTTKSGGRITYSGDKYVDKGLELARKVKNSSPVVQEALVSKRSKGDARPATWKGGKVAANQSSPNKSSSSSYGNSDAGGGSKPKSVKERKGSGPMHSGGRATGGLVARPKKKK